MLSADSIFVQGYTHNVCQDYARTGIILSEKGFAYGILSDGCSSSPDTDIGARLLVLTAEEAMRSGIEDCVTLSGIAHKVNDYAYMLRLPRMVLDATLLRMCYAKEQVRFSIVGDGVIAARLKGTSQFHIIQRHFANNMPWYLSYTTEPLRFQKLLERTITIEYIHGHLNVETGDQGVFESHSITITPKNIDSYSAEYHTTFSTSHYDLFILMSDGVESFMELHNTGEKTVVPLHKIFKELFAFKRFNGEFVTRRIKKALKGFAKRQWFHEDDLSVAAIYVGEE